MTEQRAQHGHAADEQMSGLQRSVATFDLAEQQLQREDHVDAKRLKFALELYTSAIAHAGGAEGPRCNTPADHDLLRSMLLQQRARALSAILTAAREKPLSERQRDMLRWARRAALLLALSLAPAGGWLAYDRSEIGNLALGKPWAASSHAQGLPASGTLTNSAKHFFFHTSGQEQPWLELDLGQQTRVSSVKVVNRDDCCEIRALPLVLEASSDHLAWRELARRTRTFDTWRASFSPEVARWVRLRVAKVETFHLKKIVVR